MSLQPLKQIHISLPNMWEVSMEGLFVSSKSGTKFCFSHNSQLAVLCETGMEPNMISPPEGYRLPLPSAWKIPLANAPIVMFDKDLAFDVDKMSFITDIPHELLDKYQLLCRPEKFYVESDFCFGDYVVSHKGQTGYICRKAGQVQWDFSGKAYLYTDIMRYADNIYFATAGRGGYFYLLNLESGNILTEIKTGGTGSLQSVGKLCYFLRNAPDAELLCVDLATGDILEGLKLPGKSSPHSKLAILSDRLHVLSFQYSHGILNETCWSVLHL